MFGINVSVEVLLQNNILICKKIKSIGNNLINQRYIGFNQKSEIECLVLRSHPCFQMIAI